jgi:SAM-dependent methyltransferase
MTDYRSTLAGRFERTCNRYHPSRMDPYFDIDNQISSYLDEFVPTIRGSKVLDFGAAERPWATLWTANNLEVTYADICQNSSGTIESIVNGDAVVPFADALFDCVFLMDVLEHIRNDVSCLRELARVTRSQGYLVISVPFMYRFHEVPYDYRRYTPTALREMLGENGYQVRRLEVIGNDFIVTRTILNENRSATQRFSTRAAKKLVITLLDWLKRYGDRSELAAFAFFVVAQKA